MTVSIKYLTTTIITATLNMGLVFLLFLSPVIAAEEEGTTARPAKLFTTSDVLPVTMTAPWRDIERKEKYKGTYPAKIEFTDELGNATTLDMTVERRGLTRQMVCRYPPIKLRFDKEAVKGTSIHGQKSLKMVTHCDKGSRYEQYYILEMLAYQMYNLITEFSFRVRPLAVTYVDTERGGDDDVKFAFLIEDDSDVAKRNGQKKLDTPRIKPSRLDPKEANNFALFEYMIGNLDFSPLSGPDPKKCCHNAKLIGLDPDKDPVYAIPYDFDSAGLVNAEYAMPPENLPVQNITQRLYRGFCRHNDTMPEARQLFIDNEQAILGLVQNESQLKSGTSKKAVRYLEKFFDELKDEKKYQKKIIGKCRK